MTSALVRWYHNLSRALEAVMIRRRRNSLLRWSKKTPTKTSLSTTHCWIIKKMLLCEPQLPRLFRVAWKIHVWIYGSTTHSLCILENAVDLVFCHAKVMVRSVSCDTLLHHGRNISFYNIREATEIVSEEFGCKPVVKYAPFFTVQHEGRVTQKRTVEWMKQQHMNMSASSKINT